MSTIESIYIHSFRHLEKAIINIGNKFSFSINSKTSTNEVILDIANNASEEDFLFSFGNINSISAISGSNGSGKSSVCRFIIHAILEPGLSNSETGAFGAILISDDSGNPTCYSGWIINGSNENKLSVPTISISNQKNSDINDLRYNLDNYIIYFQHSLNFLSIENPFIQEKDGYTHGISDCSNTSTLLSDYYDLVNPDDEHYVKSQLSDPKILAIVHQMKNRFRELDLVLNSRRESLPEFIHIIFDAISHIKWSPISLIPTMFTDRSLYFKGLDKLQSILPTTDNFIGNLARSMCWTIAFESIYSMKKFPNDKGNKIDYLEKLFGDVGESPNIDFFNQIIYKFFEEVNDNKLIKIREKIAFYEFAKKHCSDNIQLASWFGETRGKITIDFLNLYKDSVGLIPYLNSDYAMILPSGNFSRIPISDGESSVLQLLSRIKHSHTHIDTNNFKNIFLLIDEVDPNLHPEWQRIFFHTLVRYLNNEHPNSTFQVFVTTHSPFILSDLRDKQCNRLIRDKYPPFSSTSDKTKTKTFGANIFDLLHDDFYLQEGGYIGEIAKMQIYKISGIIENSSTEEILTNRPLYEKSIDTISDPFIRATLHAALSDKVPGLNSK